MLRRTRADPSVGTVASAAVRTVVLGGARSGKSAHAEGLLLDVDPAEVDYVATARLDPADDDLAARVAGHRERRPAAWRTVEGVDLVALLGTPAAGRVRLVDDLGTWLTAELDDAAARDAPRGTVTPRCEALVSAVAASTDRVVLVTPEVGLGVIPATRSGRLFRDEIGSLNARLAQECDEVLLLVAGIPLRLQ